MGKPKSQKIVSRWARQARENLSKNLCDALDKAMPGMARSAQFQSVERDTGVTLSTMQRITKGDVGSSIDTLSDIARNLGCSVADLLKERAISNDDLAGQKDAARQSLQRRSNR